MNTEIHDQQTFLENLPHLPSNDVFGEEDADTTNYIFGWNNSDFCKCTPFRQVRQKQAGHYS